MGTMTTIQEAGWGWGVDRGPYWGMAGRAGTDESQIPLSVVIFGGSFGGGLGVKIKNTSSGTQRRRMARRSIDFTLAGGKWYQRGGGR